MKVPLRLFQNEGVLSAAYSQSWVLTKKLRKDESCRKLGELNYCEKGKDISDDGYEEADDNEDDEANDDNDSDSNKDTNNSNNTILHSNKRGSFHQTNGQLRSLYSVDDFLPKKNNKLIKPNSYKNFKKFLQLEDKSSADFLLKRKFDKNLDASVRSPARKKMRKRVASPAKSHYLKDSRDVEAHTPRPAKLESSAGTKSQNPNDHAEPAVKNQGIFSLSFSLSLSLSLWLSGSLTL